MTDVSVSAGWPFGSIVCKLSGMVQGISVSASVFTLVAIAVDRCGFVFHFNMCVWFRKILV